tara:strand:- start:75 stop:383 length:309 start_codon:yes stop_codon:yes gene_type:complete
MNKKTSNNYIDVWDSILKTSQKFSPKEVFSLIATKAYGHSLRQVGKILKTSPTEVKKSIARLERAIKKDLKAQGANLKRLTNVHGIDHIIEIDDSNEEQVDD